MSGDEQGSAVRVSGIPRGVEKRDILRYFGRKKNGGRGDVEKVVFPLNGKLDCATVHFDNSQTAKTVLRASEDDAAELIQGAKLTVTLPPVEIFIKVRATIKNDKVRRIIKELNLGDRFKLIVETNLVEGNWDGITQARAELKRTLTSPAERKAEPEPETFKGGQDLGEFDSCLLLYARLLSDNNYGLGGPWVREERHQSGGNSNVFLSSRAPLDAEEKFKRVVRQMKRSSDSDRIGGADRYCKGKIRRAVETVSRRAPDLAVLVVDDSIVVRGTRTTIDRELGNIEQELDIEGCAKDCDVCGTGRPKPAWHGGQGAEGGARPKIRAGPDDAKKDSLLRTYIADSSTKKKTLQSGKVIYCYKADICQLPVDAIVNAANRKLEHGGGVADAIHRAAGRQLQDESRDYIKRHGALGFGQTAVTGSYRLPCKLVVHAVGPDCKGKMRKERQKCVLELHVAVLAALLTAEQEGATHVALPAISSGIYGMPLDTSCATIAEAVMFYMEHQAQTLEQVHLVDINDAAPRNFHKHLQQQGAGNTPAAIAWSLVHQFRGSAITKDAADDAVEEMEELEAGFDGARGSSPQRASNSARQGSYEQQEGESSKPGKNAAQSDNLRGSTRMESNRDVGARGDKGSFNDGPRGAAGGVGGEGEGDRCAFCDEEAFAKALKCPHLLCTDCLGYTNKYKRCPACVHHTAQARQANKLDVTGRGKTPGSPSKAGSKAGKDAAKAKLDEKPKEEEEEEPECSICLSSGADVVDVQKLDKCKHTFCKLCIENWFKQKPVCPVCKTQYGQVTGNMPNGTMRVTTHSHMSCPGYEGSGAIEIDYNIPTGVQGKNHPTPGAYFSGTKRTAYLPDTPDGRRVLRKLQTAFDRKLTFTVGRSVTTGQNDCVVWNNIHHKTSLSGGAFGYPDPDYLYRVEDELKDIGIDD